MGRSSPEPLSSWAISRRCCASCAVLAHRNQSDFFSFYPSSSSPECHLAHSRPTLDPVLTLDDITEDKGEEVATWTNRGLVATTTQQTVTSSEVSPTTETTETVAVKESTEVSESTSVKESTEVTESTAMSKSTTVRSTTASQPISSTTGIGGYCAVGIGGSCPTGTFYLHPTDCTKYLRCANGIAIELPCGSSTFFDITINVCVFASQLTIACSCKDL
ncbi:uncharacterized protein LOC143022021 [Oratosquilla oratoria]|uniref:uncharacterized protein LOC143022021 n=1 Tax=Oratosquilla oratoria TaxID=337810 RepID=UPI003F766C37